MKKNIYLLPALRMEIETPGLYLSHKNAELNSNLQVWIWIWVWIFEHLKTTFYFSYAFFRSSELSFLYKVMIKCFSYIHFRKKIIDTKQKKKNTLMYIDHITYVIFVYISTINLNE